MASQALVLGQIVVDLVLLALLSYLIFRLLPRKVDVANDGESATLVRQAGELRSELERNIEEKRQLTTKFLADLDERLIRARDVRDRLEHLLSRANGSGIGRNQGSEPSRRAAALALAARGVSAGEVASILELPRGEVELMIKLQQPPRKATP
jgi:hypothetical protein